MEPRMISVTFYDMILVSANFLVITADACKFGSNCIYPCHCKDNTVCDPMDGSCPDGCDDVMLGEDGYSGGPWSGYGCQVGNVAFGIANSRSVDGKLDACQPWIESNIYFFETGSQYVVQGYNFSILGNDILQDAEDKVAITVDDTNWRWNQLGCRSTQHQSFECIPHVVESYIRFTFFTPVSRMCEIMVFGFLYHNCSDDYFGVACGTPCNCQNACDDISGVCAGQICLDGWKGDDCQITCEDSTWGSNCTEICGCKNSQEICYHTNGSCLSGCPDGYMGTGCKRVCTPGTWGAGCGEDCNCRDDQEVCHYINGACVSGCPDGYEGDGCNLVITKSSATTLIVAVVVTLLVVTMIAVSVVIYLRKRNRRQAKGTPDTVEAVYNEHVYDYIDMENCQQPNVGAFHSTSPGLDATSRPLKVTDMDSLLQRMPHSKNIIIEEYQSVRLPRKPDYDNTNRSDGNSAAGSDNAYERLRPNTSGDEQKAPGDIVVVQIPKYRDSVPGSIFWRGNRATETESFWIKLWQTGTNRLVTFMTQEVRDEMQRNEDYGKPTVVRIGKFSVTKTKKGSYGKTNLWSLIVHNERESRHVIHFNFTDWPANGVPPVATPLVNFHRQVHCHDNTAAGPLIVCSGSERSHEDGAAIFLALDYLVDQAKAEGMVDVVQYVSKISDKCGDLIISKEQYVFLYHAVVEAVLCDETAVPVRELEALYPELKQPGPRVTGKKINKQYELLEKMKCTCATPQAPAVLDRANTSSNLERSILPIECQPPVYITIVDGTTDYINAVAIDGYNDREAYIATQWPIPDTIVDIWRLMFDHKYSCIILLDELDPSDETMPGYWPTQEESPLLISQLKVEATGSQTIEEGVLQMLEFLVSMKKKGSYTTRLYQFLDWPKEAETPSSAENILNLLEQCQHWKRQSGLGGIVFQCKSGYKRSGLLIAASYMLEILKLDHVVDVFQAVRMTRVPRPEFVPTLAQYRFLYELALAFIKSNEDYANFK